MLKNGKMYLLWLGENSACGGSGEQEERPQVSERPFYRRRAALQARNGDGDRPQGEGRDMGDRGRDCQADSTGLQPQLDPRD